MEHEHALQEAGSGGIEGRGDGSNGGSGGDEGNVRGGGGEEGGVTHAGIDSHEPASIGEAPAKETSRPDDASAIKETTDGAVGRTPKFMMSRSRNRRERSPHSWEAVRRGARHIIKGEHELAKKMSKLIGMASLAHAGSAEPPAHDTLARKACEADESVPAT